MGADGLRIDRLTLRLPAGMEGRAHVLGRLLVRQLAELRLPEGEMRLARLGLEPVRLDPGAGDLMLARSLAQAVAARLAAAASVPGAVRPVRGNTGAAAPKGYASGPAIGAETGVARVAATADAAANAAAPAAAPGGAHA